MTGERCSKCKRGHYRVYSTHIKADDSARVRYHKCDFCGHKPDDNKVVIPLTYAPRRIKMKRIK